MASQTVSPIPAKFNLIGKTFGCLTVRELCVRPRKRTVNQRWWICDCKCGGTTKVTSNDLKSGAIASCGCLKAKYLNTVFQTADTVRVLISTKDGREIGTIIVDRGDAEVVTSHQWYIDSNGYASTLHNGERTILHWLLVGKLIDHADRNKLNNRRENLRPADNRQQNANQAKRAGEYTSKYKGVYYRPEKDRWVASVQGKVNGKKKTLFCRRFKTEIEAAHAYDAAARKHFGEFAYCNFPCPSTSSSRA